MTMVLIPAFVAILAARPGLYAGPGEASLPAERVTWAEVVLPSGRVLRVEVADTEEKRARGYMFRRAVPDDEGMVFPMPSLGFHSFWMKNCEVPLDILWLDEAWKVVHLERAVPPCRTDPCPTYSPLQAAKNVLELNAGGALRLGLRVGSHIIFSALPQTRPGDEKRAP